MGWLKKLILKAAKHEEKRVVQAEPLAVRTSEVAPPWVEHPGIGPGEFFWREAGEPWKTQVWEPYYNRLSEEAQAEYLARWKVPQDWREGYFDKEWREFWDHVDDPE